MAQASAKVKGLEEANARLQQAHLDSREKLRADRVEASQKLTAVQEALAAMELDEDGSSRLNYFIQVFRSGDYPVYEDYAVHRNAEGSPFQIIVTK